MPRRISERLTAEGHLVRTVSVLDRSRYTPDPRRDHDQHRGRQYGGMARSRGPCHRHRRVRHLRPGDEVLAHHGFTVDSVLDRGSTACDCSRCARTGSARAPRPAVPTAGTPCSTTHDHDRLAAVVFDVDGTLVDSERDGHRVAFNAAFAEAGLADRWDVTTYGRLLRSPGAPGAWPPGSRPPVERPPRPARLAERLHARKTEIMRDLIADGRIQARPGVHRLLDELEAGAIPVHVATTGTRAWVEPLLEQVFGPRFQTVVTGTEVPELKPSPEVYLEVLRRTGCPADRTVAVEDSANGVRAAVAAGLRCVAAYNAYTREDDLSGATLVTGGLDDPWLVAWFRRHNGT